MKKFILLSTLLGFAITTIQAQLGKVQKPEKVPLKTIPGKTTPPAPVSNKTSEPAATSVYSLTSVRVNIRTGNDNKEFPSMVGLDLINRKTGYFPFKQLPEDMRNEMKSNSNTEVGLDKSSTAPSEHFTLESIQASGLSLQIHYKPNFFTDAWKIEGVSITLEFKDQNGVPHPTLGSKTIVFNNASGFLDATNPVLFCSTDGQLVPTTSSIR
jgi:hypothetical protein